MESFIVLSFSPDKIVQIRKKLNELFKDDEVDYCDMLSSETIDMLLEEAFVPLGTITEEYLSQPIYSTNNK